MRGTSRWPWALELLLETGDLRNGGTASVRSIAVGVVTWTGRMATGGRGMLAGFLRPLAPPAWLLGEVYAAADRFPALLSEQVETGLAGLANLNLENGLPDGARPHAATERTRRRLGALRDAGRP